LEKVQVPDKEGQLKDLYKLAKEARTKHPLDDAVVDGARRVEYIYLMQVVRNGET
jgi:hypothetical protein